MNRPAGLFKNRSFGVSACSYWTLNWIWHLLKTVKIKTTKKVRHVNFYKNHKNPFKTPLKINHKNYYFPFVQISTQFLQGA